MRFNIKKNIITFFILIVTFIAASEQKIPNIMILDNPHKEVSTIEGLKNREAAEVNIKVKKRKIEEIEGFEGPDGIEFILPDKTFLENEEIKVVKSLANLPTETPKNKQRKRSLSSIETPSTIIELGEKKIVKIPKEEAENTNYIIKIDKNSNEINKIYKGRTKRASVSPRWNWPTNGDANAGTGYQDTLYIRLGADVVDNNLLSQTIDKEFRIWNNNWWLAAIGNGFENREFTGYKCGNSSDRIILKISRLYRASGVSPLDFLRFNKRDLGIGGTVTTRSDGGYTISKIKLLEAWSDGFESISHASDVDVNLQFKSEPGLQTNYSRTGGIFKIDTFPMFGIKAHNWQGAWTYRDGPRELYILASRYPKSMKIDLHKKQLSIDSTISLVSSGITNTMGYVPDGLTKFNVIDMDASGISLDGSVLKIPPNLKSGTYRLKVVWNAINPIYGNQNINGEGDLITINYIADIEIGEVTFQIDQRLKAASGSWIRANGGLSSGINGSVTSYPELVNLNNNFSNLESVRITDVDSIEGRNTKIDVNGYKVFLTAPDVWEDEAAMPFNINLNELRNNLIISMLNSNNSNMLNNRFCLLGSNNISYKGNIKEESIGEYAQQGIATLNLTTLSKNAYTKWEIPLVSGDATSTDGVASVMKFTNGKLFNWQSSVKQGTAHIITKLKITNKGVVDELTSTVTNSKLQTTKFANNSIGVDAGGIFIYKLTESIIPETYEIEAYYKDILLGKLNLTITNTEEINIGEVVFKVDSRIPKRKLIFPNGDIKNTRDGNVENSYSEFVNLEGNFINLETTEITEVISVEGRLVKKSGNFILNNIARFDVTNGTDIDSSYIPLNFNLSSIREKVLIDNTNSNPLATGMENNIFRIKGSNGKFYRGNIKEEYVNYQTHMGADSIINMTNAELNKPYIFDKKLSPGEHQSSDGLVVMYLETNNSGELPRTNGIKKDNIVTDLVVEKNGLETNVSGTKYMNPEGKYSVSLNSQGNIEVIKLDGSQERFVDVLKIKYLYKGIELGRFKVIVTNKWTNDGDKIFKIDKRLHAVGGSWYDAKGNNYTVLSNPPINSYPELIDFSYSTTYLPDVATATKVVGREHKITEIKNNLILQVTPGVYRGETAIPKNINPSSNSIKDQLLVSFNNGTNSDYKENRMIFSGKDINGPFNHLVNIVEEIGNEVLETGTLQVGPLGYEQSIGDYTFSKDSIPGKVSAIGPPTAIKLNAVLAGKFPQTQGYHKLNIVDKLKVTFNNSAPIEVIGKTYNHPENYYSLTLLDNGDFMYSHKDQDNPFEDTVKLEYFYKDVKLGEFTIKVKNRGTYKGFGTTDITNLEVNADATFDEWSKPGTIRSRENNLEMLLKGSLVNPYSYVNDQNVILNNYEIFLNDGPMKRVIGRNYRDPDGKYEFTVNDVGDNVIKKLKEDVSYSDKIYMKYYYSNNVGTGLHFLLGQFTLNISNIATHSIGTINYKLDNRLRRYLETQDRKWSNGEGGISRNRVEWNNGLNADRQYPLLVEKTGNITMISPVDSWSKVIGRTLIEGGWGNKSIYSEKNNSTTDGLALPNTNITGGLIENEADFLKYSVFSFVNLNKGQREANTLTYIGKDKENYKFNLNLSVGNEEEYLGEGSIDLTKLIKNKTYTFIKSEVGEVSATEDSTIKLNLISGNLPQPQGYIKQNIVDSLKVTINGGSEEIINSQSFISNSKYDIILNSTTGDFQIKKKQNGGTYTDNVTIKYLYKDIVLGTFTLTVTNLTKKETGTGKIYLRKATAYQNFTGGIGVGTHNPQVGAGNTQYAPLEITSGVLPVLTEVNKVIINGKEIIPDSSGSFPYIGSGYELVLKPNTNEYNFQKINQTKEYQETLELELFNGSIELGKFNLRISNKVDNLGVYSFKLDRRFKGAWINTRGRGGDLVSLVDDTTLPEYSEFISRTDTTSLPSGYNIKSNKVEGLSYNVTINERDIYWKNNSYVLGSIGLGKTIDISNYLERLVLRNSKTDEYNITVETNQFESEKKLMIKLEVDESNVGIKGKGKINLSDVKDTVQVFSFSKDLAAGDITSNGVKLSLTGKLPQTQGYTSQNIVDSINVILNGGTATKVKGKVYENDKYKIQLNSSTGALEITKKSLDISYTDTLELAYMYKDVKLGEFILEIVNRNFSFEIIGDDIIDFGKIIQGKESKIEGNIIVRNLDSKKILKAVLNDKKPIKVLKKTDSSVELPVVGDVSILKKDIEVPIKINLTASPQINQPVGDYEGELNLYIYIK